VIEDTDPPAGRPAGRTATRALWPQHDLSDTSLPQEPWHHRAELEVPAGRARTAEEQTSGEVKFFQ
jgi:hypothetical protein